MPAATAALPEEVDGEAAFDVLGCELVMEPRIVKRTHEDPDEPEPEGEVPEGDAAPLEPDEPVVAAGALEPVAV